MKQKHLFQEQMEEIGDWFAETYKLAELDQKVQFNPHSTPPTEEYITEITIGSKNFASGLRIPAGWETWDPAVVAEHRLEFLKQQKRAITETIQDMMDGR